jgi:hypothetical protein
VQTRRPKPIAANLRSLDNFISHASPRLRLTLQTTFRLNRLTHVRSKTNPAIAQLAEHLTVEISSDQMVPGSIPGGRTLCPPLQTRLFFETAPEHSPDRARFPVLSGRDSSVGRASD